MPATFDENDADWFRTLLGVKMRDYAGYELVQPVAARIAREMLQAITIRVDQREQLAAQIAAQEAGTT